MFREENRGNMEVHWIRHLYFIPLQQILVFRIILNKAMVRVSEEAKAKLLELMREEGKPEGSFVRVGVTAGGCSGLSYNLGFDQEMKEEDKTYEDNGIKLVVDKKSFFYLVGTTLEYSGGLNGKGFIFNNPNASRTCGCGESFAV